MLFFVLAFLNHGNSSLKLKIEGVRVLRVISGVTKGFPSLSPPGQKPKSKIELSKSTELIICSSI